MKKILLTASILTTASAFAQLTQANEPAAGTMKTYNRLDNNAPEYANVTGGAAVWDYSTAVGLGMGSTRDLNVANASATSQAANFPSSTKAYDLGGFITTYTTSDAAGRYSQGFYFDDGSTQVIGKYTSNEETLLTYPLALGGSGTDAFSGTISIPNIPGASNLAANGTAMFALDGIGTLKLNSTTTINNVMRYKLYDSVTAATPFGNGYMARIQYEYYDPASTDNLPVFIWSRIRVGLPGGSPQVSQSILNSAMPDDFLALNEGELSGVSVFPNPAKEKLYVSGMDTDATIEIVTLSGQTIRMTDLVVGTTEVSLQDLKAGAYLIRITSENGSKTERIIVQ